MQKASVYCDTHHHVGQIDRRIFSGFLEHMGRAVYEGVYDPESPLSDEQGMRRDVLEALRPLGMPLVRYPGGNFVSGYDWVDGIGPKEQRPRRRDYAWKSIETNQFGTDEFMEWCAKVGTSPMLAVNLGTGDAAKAGALLEYCNLPQGTFWADKRVSNGHEKPYSVKLWCLGNEMDGPWQAGHVPAEVYAQRADTTSKYMKGLDPSIETVACGSSGRGMETYLYWDHTVLDYCWNNIDYISAHRYSRNMDNSPWFLAEGIEIDRIIEEYAALIAFVRGTKKSAKHVYLSFDEWNVWYRVMGEDGGGQVAPHLLEEIYNLEDALVCAQYLNSFLRHADVVKVACLAQIVNVIAPVQTKRDNLLIQSIYYPFLLFSRYASGYSLVPAIESPTYQAGERSDVAMLDAAMSYDERTGILTAYLINRHQEQDLSVDLTIYDRTAERVLGVDILTADNVKTANTWEQPNRMKPVNGHASITDEGHGNVTVPAPGLAVVRMQTANR